MDSNLEDHKIQGHRFGFYTQFGMFGSRPAYRLLPRTSLKKVPNILNSFTDKMEENTFSSIWKTNRNGSTLLISTDPHSPPN